jgi:hypothetical protein
MTWHISKGAIAGVLAVSLCGVASAGTLFVATGPSSQNFTLYGQGAYSPGLGSFTIGQGAGTYDSGTNTSTFILSGAITSGSPGLNSGTYEFITTYSGPDTPEAGPNAPPSGVQSVEPQFFLLQFARSEHDDDV